jgi:ferritin heavy chain
MWDKRCEVIVNEQINIEYWASYQYHLIWSYFDNSGVGLKNIAKYFADASLEEREHADKLMKYQNMRGGTVNLSGLKNVDLHYLENKEKNDVRLSFEKALEMEILVYNSLLNVHSVAEGCEDPQFTDFIEGEYLDEQVRAIDELKRIISQLNRIGNDGHGVWNFENQFVSNTQ